CGSFRCRQTLEGRLQRFRIEGGDLGRGCVGIGGSRGLQQAKPCIISGGSIRGIVRKECDRLGKAAAGQIDRRRVGVRVVRSRYRPRLGFHLDGRGGQGEGDRALASRRQELLPHRFGRGGGQQCVGRGAALLRHGGFDPAA